MDATKKGGEVCTLVAWVFGTALLNDFILEMNMVEGMLIQWLVSL